MLEIKNRYKLYVCKCRHLFVPYHPHALFISSVWLFLSDGEKGTKTSDSDLPPIFRKLNIVGAVAHVTDYTVTDYKPCSEPLHLLLEFRRTASWMTFSEVSRL